MASRHRNAFGLDGEPARPAGHTSANRAMNAQTSVETQLEVPLEEPAEPIAALASVAVSFAWRPCAERLERLVGVRNLGAWNHTLNAGSDDTMFASSVRDATPSLPNTLRRWNSTVRGDMTSRAATSRLDRPSATPIATCRSWGVS